jgi:hypothetical protein
MVVQISGRIGENQSPVMGRTRLRGRWLILVLILLSSNWGFSDEPKLLKVVIGEGETLRSIAERYLNDPNLWNTILETSNLRSAADIRPGMEISIPRSEVSLATTALAEAQKSLQRANGVGARVFEPSIIERAVAEHQLAVASREKGRWDACRSHSLESKQLSDSAHAASTLARKAAVEAVLRSRTGKVEGRRSGQLDWMVRSAGSRLIENERLRTLSSSSAVIQFANESRLSLGENSHAVIQKLRVDRIDNGQEASVSLERGEVYGLLNGTGPRNAFEVKVPGVTTDSVSTDFWISRGQNRTRIANYDQRGMRVSSAGETVTLLRNQGTLIDRGAAPRAPRSLLPAPLVTSPTETAAIGRESALLSWQAVAGAASYHVVIAIDPGFSRIVRTSTGIKKTALAVSDLPDGVYYWKVSAIDNFGFPGPSSRARRFLLETPKTPVFLTIYEPQDGLDLEVPMAHIIGRAQDGATVMIGGTTTRVGDDGLFEHTYDLRSGTNTIQIVASGANGGMTERVIHVNYRPPGPLKLAWEEPPKNGDGSFSTRLPTWSGTGITEADAHISIRSAEGVKVATSRADSAGRFQLSLPLESDQNLFEVSISATAGSVTEHELVVNRFEHPPTIIVERPTQSCHSDPELTIRGRAPGAVNLMLDGSSVPLESEQFEIRRVLPEGRHAFNLVAEDAVNRRAYWQESVLIDRTPPQLVSSKVQTDEYHTSDLTRVIVEASDNGILKRTAALTASRIGESITLPLYLDPRKNTYSTVLPVPGSSWKLEQVILEDACGNRRSFELDRGQSK